MDYIIFTTLNCRIIHMSHYRSLYIATVVTLFLSQPAISNQIYKTTDKTTLFFEQGKVIFNTSISSDGKTHYYTDNNGPQTAPTRIFERTENKNNALALDGINIPADVHITPDGKRLYFVDYGLAQSTIYYLEKSKKGWSKPIKSEQLNLGKGSGYPTSTNNGEFVFSSEGDIYFFDGKTVNRLPDAINSSESEHDPFIAQDGSFLIFVRQIPEKGDSNMFISHLRKGAWTKAVKLPQPFNGPKVDGSPYVTPDKKYLFFSSNRDGEILRTYQAPFRDYLESEIN